MRKGRTGSWREDKECSGDLGTKAAGLLRELGYDEGAS